MLSSVILSFMKDVNMEQVSRFHIKFCFFCGIGILVVPQPSKLMTRVRFPYSAPNNLEVQEMSGINNNREKMGKYFSVYDFEPNLLFEEYKKTGSVSLTFKKFNINRNSGTQVSNFRSLRMQYGVDEERSFFGFSTKEFKRLIEENLYKSSNISSLIRNIGICDRMNVVSISSTVVKKIEDFCLDNNIELSFPIVNVEKKLISRKNPKDENIIFSLNSPYSHSSLKKLFLKKVDYECSICNIDKWNGEKIVLQMDHIDGNSRNNCLENLRLLCPNCHSQTNTFSGKKTKKK